MVIILLNFAGAKKLRNAASDGTYEDGKTPTLVSKTIITNILCVLVLDLVRKGVDVTRADSKGRTALHFASCRGDANMGKFDIFMSTTSLILFHFQQ
jgi:hypothetical protein